MTSAKNVTVGDKVVTKEPQFKWTQLEKSALLGVPTAMCIFGFLGGTLSKWYGGTRIFGLAVLLEGISSILSPWTVEFSLVLYFILRILEGFFQFIAFGSFLEVFMKWAPTNEKFRMINFSFSGGMIGTILTFPVSGIILAKLGWQFVFSLSGAAAVLWYLIWAVFIFEDPMNDKFILDDEKHYIAQNVEDLPAEVTYPWRKILTSKAVWAYLNEKFVSSWSLTFAVVCLPMYIKDSFDVSISEIGMISSLPQIANFLGVIAGGPLADFLRNKNILSSPQIYVLLISLGQLTCACTFVLMGLWRNFIASIICLCLMRFNYGMTESAYLVLPIDIAGEFAGFVFGLGVSAFAIGGVSTPFLMSLVVPNQTAAEWCHYFLLLSLFNVWGFIIFYFYGSGRPEPWTAAGRKSQSDQVPKM